MPKTRRDRLRRNIGHVSYHLNRAASSISVLEDAFRDPHPEDADILIQLLEGVGSMLGVLSFLADKWGWGEIQERSWRNLSPSDDLAQYEGTGTEGESED